jgi:hypothetical protein
LIGREFGGNYNVSNLNLCHVASSIGLIFHNQWEADWQTKALD